MELVPSSVNEIALELARNAQHLTPEAQNALALYIEVMSRPFTVTTSAPIIFNTEGTD